MWNRRPLASLWDENHVLKKVGGPQVGLVYVKDIRPANWEVFKGTKTDFQRPVPTICAKVEMTFKR